jgi:hypothetical protein
LDCCSPPYFIQKNKGQNQSYPSFSFDIPRQLLCKLLVLWEHASALCGTRSCSG